MGFPALPAVRHEKQCLLLLTCVIAVFAVSASAQTDMPDATPDQPATEAGKSEVQKEVTGSEIPPEKDLKKLAKYDVERIGRRGIGRGFNLYSARRERQLGQSVASSFDHSTK